MSGTFNRAADEGLQRVQSFFYDRLAVCIMAVQQTFDVTLTLHYHFKCFGYVSLSPHPFVGLCEHSVGNVVIF